MTKSTTSKYLASRFAGHRRYFSEGHRLGRWKWFLTWCVLGVAGALLFLSWYERNWLNAQTTHGELASVHALWDQKCDACHRPQSIENASLASVLAPELRWLDLNCQSCHAVPDHHADAIWKRSPSNSCASCHHDHQGRTNSLVRIADSHCLQCHANLNEHHDKGKSAFASSVTGFPGNHPEFAVVAKQDQHVRRMYFSHARHMTPGLVNPAGSQPSMSKDAWTLDRITEKNRNDYRQPNQPDQLVRLDCASCHEKDVKADNMPNLPSSLRADGAYFQPIQFSVHCQGCHSAQMQTAHPLAGLTDQGSKVAMPKTIDLPHHLQPPELEQYLRNKLTTDLMAVKGSLTDLPYRSSTRLDSNQEISKARREQKRNEVELFLNKVQKIIYDETSANIRATIYSGGSHCLHCHLTEGAQLESRPERIVPPQIPAIWNTRAYFNHVSHRGVTCLECHQGTVADAGQLPVEKERLHLPGKDNCAQCHAPEYKLLDAKDNSLKLRGGVRHGCTDCHRYHNGDHPLQGSATSSRASRDPQLELEDFLRGKTEVRK